MSSRVFDLTMNTMPGEIKTFDGNSWADIDEMKELGIIGAEPVYQDELLTYTAALFDVSKSTIVGIQQVGNGCIKQYRQLATDLDHASKLIDACWSLPFKLERMPTLAEVEATMAPNSVANGAALPVSPPIQPPQPQPAPITPSVSEAQPGSIPVAPAAPQQQPDRQSIPGSRAADESYIPAGD